MNSRFAIVLICFFVHIIQVASQSGTTQPVTGHWNFTSDGKTICMKMDSAIRLTVSYEDTKNGTKTAVILSDDQVNVNEKASFCMNSSTDLNETLALRFNAERTLTFFFSRDPVITGDKSEQKWQLFEIQFDFVYDQQTFPDAKDQGKPASLSNTSPLKDIAANQGASYGCSQLQTQKLTDLDVTLTNLRVQAFITENDFGKALWCPKEQSSDLIPIIIGAALAALVIIVLIAYLIGRARAKSSTYQDI